MHKNVTFKNRWLPYLLVLPQMAVTIVFFIWPAAQALKQSFLVEDAFGLSFEFVWFDNFIELFTDPAYYGVMLNTALFSVGVTAVTMVIALLLAVMADGVLRGKRTYQLLLTWPYAVAPAVAGVLWLFLFNPSNGVLALALRAIGYDWNHYLNGGQAMALVIAASAWPRIAYNFIFFLAALQSIPRSLIEAAAIDGAGPARRFFSVIFPLLSPTTFFLVVVNVVYAFFETFGVIHTVTQGGPGTATEILVYKVFKDGFIGLDMGSSAAQSVVLMVIVIGLTAIQFKYIERKVQY
ncbi:sn-glycerol-3-phosphate ABC transporter permease UgpA [Halomonas alkaliantarctica]|nr:sn-glycerol-3-phosphate ABC transporter permease UgpA [Halomonas alkaliantarctica]